MTNINKRFSGDGWKLAGNIVILTAELLILALICFSVASMPDEIRMAIVGGLGDLGYALIISISMLGLCGYMLMLFMCRSKKCFIPMLVIPFVALIFSMASDPAFWEFTNSLYK